MPFLLSYQSPVLKGDVTILTYPGELTRTWNGNLVCLSDCLSVCLSVLLLSAFTHGVTLAGLSSAEQAVCSLPV